MTIVAFTAVVFIGASLLFAIAAKCGYLFSVSIAIGHRDIVDGDDDDYDFCEPHPPRSPLYQRN